MSDTLDTPARPVSLITTMFVLVLFALFLFFVRHFYAPAEASPQNAAAENLPKEQMWKSSAETRRAALKDLRQKQIDQGSAYGWVDQKAGIVQLPIDRAMELTVQKYGAKQ